MKNTDKKVSVHKVYRIKSPVKLCIFFTMVVLIILLVITSLWIKGKAMEPVSTINIEVSQGETLWSIAKEYLPENRDIRDFILEIKSINDLNDAGIQAGQYITIPVYDRTI